MQNTATKISALRAQLAALEKAAARERARLVKKLATLPAKYGVSNMVEFIALLGEAGGLVVPFPDAKVQVRGIAMPSTNGHKPAMAGKRHRTLITPELIAKIKAMHKAKKTDAEISATLGINRSTVQRHKA